MASTAQYRCKSCGNHFFARTVDRNRGWARFCSKKCKAIKQTQKGGSLSGKHRKRHDGFSEMLHKECDTCGLPAINGVYTNNPSHPIEWGCFLHHDTTPFTDDHGQW